MFLLETDRLIIKPVEIQEAPQVAALITEDISRWTSQVPWPYELHHAKYWIDSNLPWARLGIYLNDELIGTIKCPMSDDDEIGFIISEDHRNKGYITEATKAVIDFAFDNFSLQFISSSAHPENVQSNRVHEKLGFRKIKEAMHFWPNKNKDMPVILYRLVR